MGDDYRNEEKASFFTILDFMYHKYYSETIRIKRNENFVNNV